MKIGINASFLRKPGTGIGQVTVHFINELAKVCESRIENDGASENFQFPILDSQCILYTEEPVDCKLPENFTIQCFLPQWWKRDDVLRKWLWERMLAQKALQDGCDVFLSLYQSATVMGLRYVNGASHQIRHTMVVHDIIPQLFPEYRNTWRRMLYWKSVVWGIMRANHIIAISERTKKDLITELALPEAKISVSYPDVAPQFRATVSHEEMERVLNKYALSSGYIYHGGGLERRKNTETLLRAYAHLLTKHQANGVIPPLVISGKIFDKTNTLATDVEGLREELALQKQVKLLGFVPERDLPALYKGALFFVYPSLYEGFGLPVLEAVCLGVPVLSSNAASLPEVGGNAAVYVDPQSEEKLSSQMERLYMDQALRASIISKSYEQAARFSWKGFVDGILKSFL